MGPERKIEKYLHDQIKKRGGMCIKLIPVGAGIPDRLILLPGGHIFLVETKAPGGRLRPIQRIWHERAARIGVFPFILASKGAVDEWLKWIDSES